MPDPGFASRQARDLAAELGVDSSSIAGSGKGGAVTVADLRRQRDLSGLDAAGRALVNEVRAAVPDGFELDERELALLDLAAHQADNLSRLETAIERDGVLTTGSTGQVVVHPAVPEARQARLAIGRLLGMISLPVEGRAGTEASRRGQQAARKRWEARGARHAA